MVLNSATNELDVGFIIGSGRCGSTLAAQFLNAHTQICVPPELQIIFEYSQNGRRLNEIFASEEQLGYKADDFIREIERMCPHKLRDYFDLCSFFQNYSYPVEELSKLLNDLYRKIAMSQRKQVFIEQSAWYGQRIDLLKELFPEAKFIHMVRDGRDVALSFVRTPWWHNDPLLNVERWASEITKIADDAEHILTKDCYLEVRYEDMVLNTEEVVAKMTRFLGKEFEPMQLNLENHLDYTQFRKFDGTGISSAAYNNWRAKGNKSVFTDNVLGWKKHGNEHFSNLSASTKSVLARFGYETL
jgi:hypothetical protein